MFIKYTIPSNTKPGQYSFSVVVQELGGMNEEKRIITFRVVDKAIGSVDLTLENLGFIKIQGGTYNMGSNDYQFDERPSQSNKVNTFYIMDHELTFKEIFLLKEVFPDTILMSLVSQTRDYYLIPDEERIDYYPVSVNFEQSQKIAELLSKKLNKKIRLPQENEWEYAARGGLKNKDYVWGNETDSLDGIAVIDLLNAIPSCFPMGLCPYQVKTKTPPNNYGLFDMAGNVWEWTSSVYNKYPFKHIDVSKYFSKYDEKNMVYASIRGGGYAEETSEFRVSFRGIASKYSDYGCRFVYSN